VISREYLIKQETAEYLKSYVYSESEIQEVTALVSDGNSIYDNPWYIYDEQCCLIDYIAALRQVNDLCAEHQ
jgi:hypothetical protein